MYGLEMGTTTSMHVCTRCMRWLVYLWLSTQYCVYLTVGSWGPHSQFAGSYCGDCRGWWDSLSAVENNELLEAAVYTEYGKTTYSLWVL